MLFVMFLKGSKSHRCFDCQVRNTRLGRVESRGSRVRGNWHRCSLSSVKIAPPKPGGGSVNEEKRCNRSWCWFRLLPTCPWLRGQLRALGMPSGLYVLLGETSSWSCQPHLPCTRARCWALLASSTTLQVILLPAASTGDRQPLRQMLRASSLEPQIRNWLPAAPAAPASPHVFPGRLQHHSSHRTLPAHGQSGHRTGMH